MTLVGSGRYGQRSDLVTAKERLTFGSTRNALFVHAQPSLNVTGWTLYSGNVYSAPLLMVLGALPLELAAVATTHASYPLLSRVELLSDLASVPGAFHFDIASVDPSSTWDNGKAWDENFTFDNYPLLYVNLGGTDPNEVTICARGALKLASAPVVYPHLGGDKLGGTGLFEVWSAGVPTGFTFFATDTNFALAEDPDVYYGGSRSARIDVLPEVKYVAPAVLGAQLRKDALLCAQGQRYRIFVRYMTHPDNTDSLFATLSIRAPSGGYLRDDGWSYGGDVNATKLRSTSGRWRVGIFDFVSAESGTLNVRVGVRTDKGGQRGSVWFDELTLQPILRFTPALPRLKAGDNTTVEQGSNELWFGDKQIGSTRIAVANTDGMFDGPSASYLWAGGKVSVEYGPVIGDDSKRRDGETLIDTERVFQGIVRSARPNDDELVIEAESVRDLFWNQPASPRTFNETDDPDGDPSFWGQRRRLLFGERHLIPARVAKNGAYPVFEVADCQTAPNGIKDVSHVLLWRDEESRRAGDYTGSRVVNLVTAGGHVTVDLATGKVQVDACIMPIFIGPGDDMMPVDFGGAVRTAVIAQGLYTPKLLAAAVQTALNGLAGSGGDCTCTFSESTYLITVGKGAGTLNLRNSTNSGAAPDRLLSNLYSKLGYPRMLDQTGSLSYAANVALYEVKDIDTPKVSVIAQGYKDDGSGTYTGTANAVVVKGSDVLRVLFKIEGRPQSFFGSGWNDARTSAPETLSVLWSDGTLGDFFNAVERSTRSDVIFHPIRVGWEGLAVELLWRRFTGTLLGNEVRVYDSQFVAFDADMSSDEVFQQIRVRYALGLERPWGTSYRPDEEWYSRYATAGETALLYERANTKLVDSLLRYGADAQALAAFYLSLYRRPRRLITATVMNALLLTQCGDIVLINRARGPGLGGDLVDSPHRVVTIKQDYLGGTSEVLLVEVDS